MVAVRKVIPLHQHPACQSKHHVLVRSTRVIKSNGRATEVNIYLVASAIGTPDGGYVVVYDNSLALEGYFSSEAEAVTGWETHAHILRGQAVAS